MEYSRVGSNFSLVILSLNCCNLAPKVIPIRFFYHSSNVTTGFTFSVTHHALCVCRDCKYYQLLPCHAVYTLWKPSLPPHVPDQRLSVRRTWYTATRSVPLHRMLGAPSSLCDPQIPTLHPRCVQCRRTRPRELHCCLLRALQDVRRCFLWTPLEMH